MFETNKTSRKMMLCRGAWLLGVVVCLAGSALAGAPPTPLAPHDLPGETSPYPAAGDQTNPAIARGAEMYLVAWTDERTSQPAAADQAGSAQDIYAARLDAEGNLIDTIPIVINQAASDQFDPLVVWNGENWLVIWSGTVPYGPAQIHTIEAARVTPAGDVLDPDPIVVWTQGNHSERLLGAASDGQDWALVIVDHYVQGFNTRTRLVGRRITATGDIVSAPYYLFSPACCYFFHHGGLAYADGVYMAVFEGYVSGSEYGIFGLRMSPTLTTLDSYPVVIAQIAMAGETTFYRTPNVTSDGSQFLVGWQRYQDGAGSQVYAARVNTTATSLDGNGFPVSDALALSLDLSPDLAWDGTQWIVGWSGGGLNLARVDAAGNVLDPGGVPLPGLATGAFAGTVSGGLQLAWSEARVAGPAPHDVFAAVVSSALDLGPDQCVSLGVPSQTQADLAAGHSGYMLAYRSDISGESRIMAHPLDSSGQALTGEPIVLGSGRLDGPRVAFAGAHYLVVWSDMDQQAILAARLAEDGMVLDSPAISVSNGIEPDVAGREGLFLVLASQNTGVYGTRVAGDGNVLDLPPLLLGNGANLAPRVANLGMYWLATWESLISPDGSDIQATVVDLDGNVVGPLAITVPGDGLAHHRPAVAAGDTALIAWQDARAGQDDINLYGRRISANITFLDPPTGFVIADGTSDQTGVAIAWDGANYLTSFSDDRNAVNQLDMRTDIYRNWVSRYGLVDEPAGLALFADSVPEIGPALCSLQGNSLYAASVFRSDVPYAAYRIKLRLAPAVTDVGDARGETPELTRLMSVFPNPANPAVKIRFSLARASAARVEIFNLQGARVRTLQTSNLGPGQHELHWNGRDGEGQTLPSGTYLFRFHAGTVQETGKAMLVR